MSRFDHHPRSEYAALLDDLAEFERKREEQRLSKAGSCFIRPAPRLHTAADTARTLAKTRRVAAELEGMAKSLTAGDARQRAREGARGVLRKAMSAFGDGKMTALQVAAIEARVHHLDSVLG